MNPNMLNGCKIILRACFFIEKVAGRLATLSFKKRKQV